MGREINYKAELLRELEMVFNLGPEDDSTHPMDVIRHGLNQWKGANLECLDRMKARCMDLLLMYRSYFENPELLEVKE